jgi:hypothetical protein
MRRSLPWANGGGYSSSPGQRFGVGKRELRVGRDVAWGGGSCRPFL